MAAGTSGTPPEGSNTPVAKKSGGDHDRVAMLSLKADGTPDQVNPEFIGDKGAALAATEQQFVEQAVSAADVEERGVSSGGTTVEDAPQDPTVKKLEKAHASAEKAGKAAAKKAVDALHESKS